MSDTRPRRITLPRVVEEALVQRWSLIPCGKNKKPLIQSWKEFQIKAASSDQIMEWHRQLRPVCWGVVTGAISNLIVLDFDGPATALVDRLGLTPNVRTGSGGVHVYAVHSGHFVSTRNSKTTRELGLRYPGLDVRGDGGYAVFAGENRFGRYEQLQPLAVRSSLQSLPADLRLLLGLATEPDNGAPLDAEGAIEELTERALERSLSEGRNNSGFWLARQFRDSGYSEQQAKQLGLAYVQQVAAINIKGQVEPYTRHEYTASVHQAFSRKPKLSSMSNCGNDIGESSENTAESPICELQTDGVYWRKSGAQCDSPFMRLASPVRVQARTRDPQGNSWGLLVEWEDAENRTKSWVMPMSLLSGDGSEIGRRLRDGGLPYLTTNPQLRCRFLDYLQLSNPNKYVCSTGRTGWQGTAFVLPDRTIAADATTRRKFGSRKIQATAIT